MNEEVLKAAMQLTIEEPEACVREVKVTLPAETVEEFLSAIIGEVGMLARIPGFRPGKAPAALVKNRFGNYINEEAAKRFRQLAIERIAADESFDIVSITRSAEDNNIAMENGDYEININLNIAPEIKLPEYKGLKSSAPEIKVTEDSVNREIDHIREMYAEYAAIEDKAQSGDMLKVNYSSDFIPPEKASAALQQLAQAQDSWVWLNEPEMLPGITAAVSGAKADEEREFTAEYPEDFREGELAGKKVKYQLKVLEVHRRQPVQDDQELCKLIKVDSIDFLKERIRENLTATAEREAQSEIRNELVNKIIAEAGKFPLPPALLEDAVQREFRKLANEQVKSEEDVEAFMKEREKHEQAARQSAENRLHRFFALRKIARNEGLELRNDEIDSHVRGISQHYGMKEKDLRQRLEDNGMMDDLQMDIMMNKAVDFIFAEADIQEADKKKDTDSKKSKDDKASA